MEYLENSFSEKKIHDNFFSLLRRQRLNCDVCFKPSWSQQRRIHKFRGRSGTDDNQSR